jgi:hypothetical protein
MKTTPHTVTKKEKNNMNNATAKQKIGVAVAISLPGSGRNTSYGIDPVWELVPKTPRKDLASK